MTATSQNIDALCARHGWAMADAAKKAFGSDKKSAEKTENLITQALAILQEQGVYAFFLFLHFRNSKGIKAAGKITDQALAALGELQIKPYDETRQPDALKAVRDTLANNLDDLLMAKRVLEQMLIYARYHAKASGVQDT